jgi:hypothetical protein
VVKKKWAIDKWQGTMRSHLLIHMNCPAKGDVHRVHHSRCEICGEKPPKEMVVALRLMSMDYVRGGRYEEGLP